MVVSCWVCGLWYDNAGSDWQCPHTPIYGSITTIPLITPPSVTPTTTTTDPTPEEE